MAHRASVNQQVQIGPEVTAGTSVAASKLLKAFTWVFGDKPTTKQFTGTGAKYPSVSETMTEMAMGKITGEADYQALIYPINSVFGKATAVLHSPSVTAYDWIWTPILTGIQTPQTYTVQQGDTVDAEQYAYLMFSGFGYAFSRKEAVAVTGDWFSQTMTDGASLTASPTTVAQVPMVGKQFNVFLDATSAGIGATQLNNIMKVDFAASNYYTEFWPINRANASFTAHIDAAPKCEFKITLEADPTGMGIRTTYLQLGARAYIRVNGVGPVADSGNAINYGMTHDMCVFVTAISDFTDTDGIYAVEYTCEIAEDTAWASGQSQKLTLTNLLSVV